MYTQALSNTQKHTLVTRYLSRYLAACCLDRSSSTNCARRSGASLTRLTTVVDPLILPAQARVLDARVRDGSAITIVTIDPRDDLGAIHIDVGEGALAGHLRATVAAGAVDFADIGHVEVLDGYGPAAVVLQHLVVRIAGAAAVDV